MGSPDDSRRRTKNERNVAAYEQCPQSLELERKPKYPSKKNILEWLWRVLSQFSVAYIDIRFFAHATENVEKVVTAVQHVLPSNYTEDITFKKSNLQGHYGNPITLFEAKIRDKGAINALVENLSFCLGESDKKTLSNQIHLHMERGSLYIRLDKQVAFQGKLKLCTSDPIRIRLRFKKARVEEIIKTCQELGLLK